MADQLMNEVDADVRAERMHAFWLQYRGPLLAAVVALILGTAASQIWHHQREKKGGEMLQQLVAAQKLFIAQNYVESAEKFGEISKTTTGELQRVTQLWQARAYVAAGNTNPAITLFTSLASGADIWADMACLRLAALDLNNASCLAVKAQSPLALTRAKWEAARVWAKGDGAGARSQLQSLMANPEMPPAEQAELQQWLSLFNASKDAK